MADACVGGETGGFVKVVVCWQMVWWWLQLVIVGSCRRCVSVAKASLLMVLCAVPLPYNCCL
jgi:hypothetical protein